MMTSDLADLDKITPADRDAVGGKALGLARLAAAGLPMPPGFCLPTAVHRRLRGRSLREEPDLVREIAATYQWLGSGAVAVRSSAVAEDGSAASFAGQQETVLGVCGAEAVCAAIERCWASAETDRAAAYRRQRGLTEVPVMAVIVQQLVEAESAGVLFTRDPLDPQGRLMLVEAAWGLGDAVVSGRVSPDRFHLDRDTGRVVERQVERKPVQSTVNGPAAVPPEKQDQPSLTDGQLAELAALGRRVEELFGGPRDVEWAWAQGKFWLLQARPITTADAFEREQVRREEIATLAARAEPGGTVWSRYNLAESLPAPTPMTWAVVRRMMSGRGGYGLMHRDLGFRPDRSLDEHGVFDLVAGRPYCNLSREPRLYPGWLPHEHPFARLKADPARALDPRAVPRKPAQLGAAFWLLLPLRLPFLVLGGVRFAANLGQLSRTFANRFRREIAPAFVAETARAAAEDWSVLADAALLDKLELWIRRSLYEFARDGLKPTALAAVAKGNLERWLARKLGPERGPAAVRELIMGVRLDPEADLGGAVAQVVAGRLDCAEFLAKFGHRGPNEMELASPRWGEDHAALDRLLTGAGAPAPPLGQPEDAWERIAAEAKLSALERTALEPQYRLMNDYLALRETARHHLMRGFLLMRKALAELDRRHGLQGGVFFLTPEELPRLAAGEDLSGLIAQRRRRRAAALSLEVPAVLFSDDLEAIGRPVVVEGGEVLRGVPLSAGSAEAPALVLDEPPSGEPSPGPYVLVCPSTDPAWVPLFVRARGLVMETGGVLSHGAIVAREFGLPAVAGLPDVRRRVRGGQRLRVDGAAGTVTILDV
jgi:pyruvate,water dikinase